MRRRLTTWLLGGVFALSASAWAQAPPAGHGGLDPYETAVRDAGGRVVLRGQVKTAAGKGLPGALPRDAAGGPVDNALEVRL